VGIPGIPKEPQFCFCPAGQKWREMVDPSNPGVIIETLYSYYTGVETRLDFPHADPVGECTVFNIEGNKYRLITKIRYNKQRVYIIHVLTHKEYDREKWKDDCNC
jgi:HigB_toxin, RelE-like toxic component of a toxin-antitoxin system